MTEDELAAIDARLAARYSARFDGFMTRDEVRLLFARSPMEDVQVLLTEVRRQREVIRQLRLALTDRMVRQNDYSGGDA